MSRRALAAVALSATMAVASAGVAGTASADRPTALVSSKSTGPTTSDIVVHAASMNRDIPLTVIHPRNTSKPAGVLYLLNGAGGGEDAATWQGKTDIVKFFSDKNVYVVIPMEGAFTYYTDWIKPEPVLHGVNKWSTFLAKELPPVVSATYNTNGRNAIAGISSSGTSVLNLAIQNPGLYRAVGAYSGCAATSNTYGSAFIQVVVEARGEADVKNMWGPVGGPLWKANDPVIHAEGLRGTSLYLSSANGLPGPHDNLQNEPSPGDLADRIMLGGTIEAATNYCTEQLVAKLNRLNIPATVDRPGPGTHSWPYWQDQLHKSWPQLARAIR